MIFGVDGSRGFMSNRTGTENYSYQLLKYLAKVDTNNRYIIFLRPGNSVDKKDWPENFEFRMLNYKKLWTQFGLSLETYKTKMDLLFVPSHTLPLNHPSKLKTVMVVHDLGSEYLPQMHQLKQRLYLNWITTHQFKSATKLIAVSEATKKDLINRTHVSGERVEVVYEGVDKRSYRVMPKTEVAKGISQFGVQEGSYFLYISTIQPRKNLVRLMEAFSLYLKSSDKGEKLLLAGGKGWLTDEIYATPKRLGLEERIQFLGYVPTDQVVMLLNGTKALVYPSLFEGFGLPILEAYACGCPVLTSNISSMPEVAGDGAVLVDPYDIASISDGLKQFNDPKQVKLLIERGFKQLDNFSWERCAKETLAVLEDVCRG
jgi:glycosyltransferase involved in cell wall biosynthesis